MKMKDLKNSSGLPLKLKGNKLVFGGGMREVKPDVRTHEQMLPVLMKPKAKAPNEFYYMYREVCLEKDRRKIAESSLRYDITILPPFSVGGEMNKTFGHFHPGAKGQKEKWPEVYEVLSGHAHYILQSKSEILVFDAREGDKCLMLPGFGHVTVNPSSKEPLVMANWVYPGFSSEYGEIEKSHGGAWFETERGFVKNPHYKKVPPIQLISAKKFPALGFTEKPLYTQGTKSPKKFAWLSKPWKYKTLFAEYRKQ